MSDETFDVWPHDPTQIVKEALREYVGDGDGEDERVLAAHDERVRRDERERIARSIEAARVAALRGTRRWPIDSLAGYTDAARIAREGEEVD